MDRLDQPAPPLGSSLDHAWTGAWTTAWTTRGFSCRRLHDDGVRGVDRSTWTTRLDRSLDHLECTHGQSSDAESMTLMPSYRHTRE